MLIESHGEADVFPQPRVELRDAVINRPAYAPRLAESETAGVEHWMGTAGPPVQMR